MHSTPLNNLVHELSKLPTIGEKTALRLALHILRQPVEYGQNLAKALNQTVGTVHFCKQCFHITASELCEICSDSKREATALCVVEEVSDLLAIESTHSFRGQFHVLHGALSPIDGIGPEDLKIGELHERLVQTPHIKEVILATNPNVSGDVTALYISKQLKDLDVKITKLASGIPVGSHIEFIDQNTLTQAIEQRLVFS